RNDETVALGDVEPLDGAGDLEDFQPPSRVYCGWTNTNHLCPPLGGQLVVTHKLTPLTFCACGRILALIGCSASAWGEPDPQTLRCPVLIAAWCAHATSKMCARSLGDT